MNERTIKLNQSYYRDFRVNPPQTPFRSIFVDHCGPYWTKLNGVKKKVWILCITCLWCRSINLKLCKDLTVKEYLRVFQMHVFEYGMPEQVLSDLGTQLVAGGNLITDLLKDPETQLYFQEHNVNPTSFDQYFKGNHALGSLVESCVKMTKRLIPGAIRNSVLSLREFELIIAQTICLVNKRPIAFKESIRDENTLVPEIPPPITPELLIKGYETLLFNVSPEPPENELTVLPIDKNLDNIRAMSSALSNSRVRFNKLYHEEFLGNLLSQATNVKGRYLPQPHKPLKVGDIVLLKEEHLKFFHYPMAVVKTITKNDLDEVTGVMVRKGNNREIVKRHVNSVIPYMSVETFSDNSEKSTDTANLHAGRVRESRQSAVVSRQRTQRM